MRAVEATATSLPIGLDGAGTRGGGSGVGVVLGLLISIVLVAACQQAAAPTQRPVVFLGSWTGSERDAFEAVTDEFTARTGNQVEYIETRDLDGVIKQRLHDGQPLDVAGVNGPRHLAELAGSGSLQPLAPAIDVNRYKAEIAPTFVSLGSVDGRLYGAFIKSSVKGLIWYRPRAFKRGTPITWDDLLRLGQSAAPGETKPWCVGLASGESSGWPGTDWIETILIHQSGPDVYDRWVAGVQPWSSPEVRRAFETFGQVVADDAVFGGEQGAIQTDFAASGDPLFSDPPGCMYLNQGSFMIPFLAANGRVAGQDFDFYPFPEMSAAYDGSVIGGGDLIALFSDNPAARDLVAFLTSSDGQAAWVATGGGVLSINSRVTDYPTPVELRAAQLLVSAKDFRFDGSDQMPSVMNEAFLKAVLEFTADQGKLLQILDNLDAVRQSAYAQ
jgi:alpha-glucoside transport system substrate-binding protein